jgi:hypothetical protein
MKNKFLALAAFGAAALGGAVISAPANAQITPGPTQNIIVNVSVPEVLYLRTISNFDLEITPEDLTGELLDPVPGSTPPAFTGTDQLQEADGTVNTASPFAGGFADIGGMKTITSAYIVWSNSPTGKYQVQVTAPPGGLVGPDGATLNVALVGTTYPVELDAEGLVTATPQNIELELSGADDNIKAGTYTGDLTVEAFRP